MTARQLNFMAIDCPSEPIRVMAKVRYAHQGAWCTVTVTGEDEVLCVFDEPVRAITPGQAVVFYDGEIVVGGGVIEKAMDF